MCIFRHTNRFSFLLIFITAFLLASQTSLSQCCSTGSPVGASVNVGVLGKNTLRVIGFYRYSYSDTYYQNDSRTDDNVPLSHAYYNFTGMTFGYGITKRLTAETDFGYFFNKTQVYKPPINYKETGYGLSNWGLTFKYGIFIKPLKQIEIMGGLGVRFPFSGNPQMKDNVQLSRDVQPSTNAFGVSGLLFFNKGFPDITLRLFSINKYDYNFADKTGYTYGNILLNSIFVSKKAFTNFFCILQVRSQWKTRDNDEKNDLENHDVVNSGYILVTVTPQISYSIAGQWNVSLLYDIPVYKYYNGKQLTPKFSAAISLSKDFNLGRRHKVDTKDLPR
jgi:hypothetical protein